jgi:hypothetical protein
MEDLIIANTKKTPEITFLKNGNLSIKGISTPENVSEFYQPVFSWLETFQLIKPASLEILFDFDYLNTSTTSIILKLLRRIMDFKASGASVNITWKHDEVEDDIAEQGTILRDLINYPITLQLK